MQSQKPGAVGVDVYIGAGIEHGSERFLYEHVLGLVAKTRREAIVLANVSLCGRQVDLVVALRNATFVFEAKGNRTALRGNVNGSWQVRIASGRWKRISNLYAQAVSVGYAVRDAMRDFTGEEVPYPSAALVFTPSIPSGSAIECRESKARVLGVKGVEALLKTTGTSAWSFADWHAFAHHHRLTRLVRPEAAFDPQLLIAEETLSDYTTAFRRTYFHQTRGMVPFECLRGEPISSDQVIAWGAAGADLLLRGPSGCGKSMIACQIALDCLEAGRIPVLVTAKDFDGSLRDLVHREAVLLGAPSARELVGACVRLSRPMAFILDGYNECAQQRRAHLTRVFSAAARRYEASAVVTTQIPLEQDELLSLTTVEILEPSIATKRRIAEIAAEIDLQDASIEPLLEFVRNGFEARLVGEVGRAVPVGGSRYSIFDRYVRKRLGEDASEGITALAHIAHLFSQRIAFSMTARDRDRVAEAERIPVHLLARLQNANLFVERAGRASFGHELLLNAFSAEAVVRRAAGDADAILAALASPQNAERKTLIVGAIDEEALAVRVLSAVSDPAIIEDCVAGQCGRLAQDWVERRCREVMTRLREETMQLSFLIDEKGFMGIRPDPETLLAWTPTDRAVLATFPRLIAQGRYLDDLLRIAREMDTILAQEHARLREMLEGKKIALRSALFAASYFWHGHNAPALSAICSPLHSGVSLWAKRPPYWDQITKQLARDNLSHGELYILLLIYRHAGFDGPSITHLLPGLLKHFWRSAAYHLRLELMDRAHSGAFRATEEDRIKLVETIEDLLSKTDDVLMSTSMLDVLKNLGALDDSQAEHTETVRENIREVLAGADDPDMQALAFGVWYGQFDHPYDGAYYEALSELCPADKKALLWMAAQGANDDSPFISCLLVELASFSDPAAGAIIARWTALLPKKIVMRQDAIGNFASAYITLGRLGCALPKIDEIGEEADSAAALAACGRIFYWLNRADLPMEDRRAAAAQAVAVLSNQKNIATSVLNEFYRVDMLTREALDQLPGTEPAQTSIGACFPSEIAEMARVCLSHPSCQHGYFDWFEARSTFDFAIQALGFWGTVADIPLLRAWAVDPSSGTLAVDAIKKLEQCYLLPRSA